MSTVCGERLYRFVRRLAIRGTISFRNIIINPSGPMTIELLSRVSGRCCLEKKKRKRSRRLDWYCDRAAVNVCRGSGLIEAMRGLACWGRR